MKLDIFFSCSFDAADKEVNDFFAALCRALDMQLMNVSTGATATPPEVAKAMIEQAQALVAICARRAELIGGGYTMPEAVHDEISFAFGKDTPVLMLVEDGVKILGFKPNFGTYLPFKRDELGTPEFLELAVRALYQLRLEIDGSNQTGIESGISGSHADYVHHLVELLHTGDDFLWRYSTSKKLVYTQPSKRGFPSGVWSTVPANVPEESAHAQWSLTLKSSSRDIKLIETVERRTPSCIEVMLKPEPYPEDGDFIEYATTSSSRYINAVWADEVPEGACVHLDSGDYQCADGLVFIHRTKSAIIEFRFAAEYGFSRRDVVPFVGSYTSAIDYEVGSEIERANVRVDEFGGNLTVRIEVESPLPGHLYGIAWNPKARPVDNPSLANSSASE